jgi:hypothetical protein
MPKSVATRSGLSQRQHAKDLICKNNEILWHTLVHNESIKTPKILNVELECI